MSSLFKLEILTIEREPTVAVRMRLSQIHPEGTDLGFRVDTSDYLGPVARTHRGERWGFVFPEAQRLVARALEDVRRPNEITREYGDCNVEGQSFDFITEIRVEESEDYFLGALEGLDPERRAHLLDLFDRSEDDLDDLEEDDYASWRAIRVVRVELTEARFVEHLRVGDLCRTSAHSM